MVFAGQLDCIYDSRADGVFVLEDIGVNEFGIFGFDKFFFCDFSQCPVNLDGDNLTCSFS